MFSQLGKQKCNTVPKNPKKLKRNPKKCSTIPKNQNFIGFGESNAYPRSLSDSPKPIKFWFFWTVLHFFGFRLSFFGFFGTVLHFCLPSCEHTVNYSKNRSQEHWTLEKTAKSNPRSIQISFWLSFAMFSQLGKRKCNTIPKNQQKTQPKRKPKKCNAGAKN